MYIEEEPFEPLDIVEVAMDNENNALRKRASHLAPKREGNISEWKIKRPVQSIINMKT